MVEGLEIDLDEVSSNDIHKISAIEDSDSAEGLTRRRFEALSPEKAFKMTSNSGTLTLTSPECEPRMTEEDEEPDKPVFREVGIKSQPVNLICRSYYESNSSVLIGTPSKDKVVSSDSGCDLDTDRETSV